MNIVLLLAHSIEEHDQVKLLSELDYDVFSIGGYIDPAAPHDPKRPALPDAPRHPELQSVVDGLGTPDNLDLAKRHIPDDIIDWADAIIVHHHEHRWIVPQWERIKHKRVIWRTVGQSVEANERLMAPLRSEGLQIVRYSPKERNIPGFAGEDALIRFYKDPDEWTGWTGESARVLNISQHHDTPHGRDRWLNWPFWEEVTRVLPNTFAGPHTEKIGGLGTLSYEEMQRALRLSRCYLYTGTQPASYTLGLIEAMMTGIPVVSIGPEHMTIFPYGPDMFEGHEIVSAIDGKGWRWHPWSNDPDEARNALSALLSSKSYAVEQSRVQRDRAIELFGKAEIGRQWKAFLG
ncbi:MAG: hypothetical protein Q8P61_05480 [Candidatus Nanopelagicales bacterium]|nr:hypothetical protein [Candidatus Nanopelagicales bacterium]